MVSSDEMGSVPWAFHPSQALVPETHGYGYMGISIRSGKLGVKRPISKNLRESTDNRVNMKH
jgi:hypothetical protein